MNFVPEDWMEPEAPPRSSRDQVGQRLLHWYQPDLYERYQSFDELMAAVTPEEDTAAMLEKAAWILRRRFVHAYSVYDNRENWIAAICGRYIWFDLAAKVLPEDILRGRAAACSQVSIVFIELCRRLHIPARRISLKGHFACEAKYADRWRYFDLDLKPNFQQIGGRMSIREIVDSDLQMRLYAGTIVDSSDVKRIFSSLSYGTEDEWLAPRAEIFHRMTQFLSHWFWLFLMLAGGFLGRRFPAEANP